MVSSKVNSKSPAIPFWLWPNVLSLDAPSVAVCWQLVLGRTAGVRVPFLASVALAIAVWSVYVLDRVLDGPAECSARHLFAAVHRRTFLRTVATVDLICAAWVLPALPTRLLLAGLGIAAGCGLYLIAAQSLISGRKSKAIAMALLFSAGIVFPVALLSPSALLSPFSFSGPVTLFLATAAVVWANTRLIGIWETGTRLSGLNRLLLLAAGAVLVSMGTRYMEALSLGCWLMLSLDITDDRVNADLRRSLADAVLVLAAAMVSRP